MDLTPPVGIDLDASHQTQLRATYSATYGLAVVAVALRLVCRLSISKTKLWWDDYIICTALVGISNALLIASSLSICCRDAFVEWTKKLEATTDTTYF
jgi:hypothetical protein